MLKSRAFNLAYMFIAHIYEQRAVTLLAREYVVETLRDVD